MDPIPEHGTLNANGTLVERVTSQLREAILQGQLEPGSRIGQDALAREFGTSRLPVREALRLLQNEGLVSIRPNAGARVTRLTIAELNEVYLLRERLEPLALAESIPHLSNEQIDELRGYVDTMESVANAGDRWGWLELDMKFHLATFAAAPLPRLLQTILGFWNIAIRYRRVYTMLWFPADLGVQHSEHRLLMNAIERRYPTDAELVLTMHIRRTRLSLTQHREIFEAEPDA